jgi:hypothetical protein
MMMAVCYYPKHVGELIIYMLTNIYEISWKRIFMLWCNLCYQPGIYLERPFETLSFLNDKQMRQLGSGFYQSVPDFTPTCFGK